MGACSDKPTGWGFNLASFQRAWNHQLIFQRQVPLLKHLSDVPATVFLPLRPACSVASTEYRSRKTQAAMRNHLIYALGLQHSARFCVNRLCQTLEKHIRNKLTSNFLNFPTKSLVLFTISSYTMRVTCPSWTLATKKAAL